MQTTTLLLNLISVAVVIKPASQTQWLFRIHHTEIKYQCSTTGTIISEKSNLSISLLRQNNTRLIELAYLIFS